MAVRHDYLYDRDDCNTAPSDSMAVRHDYLYDREHCNAARYDSMAVRYNYLYDRDDCNAAPSNYPSAPRRCNSSRIFNSPSRIRVFTVPSGVFVLSAISC